MNRRHRANSSFSSSLLDEIYRSIDGGGERNEKEEVFAYAKKRNNAVTCQVEKKPTEKLVGRRVNWSSSSSDSSSGDGFSSSELESRYSSHRPKPIRTSFPVQHERFEPSREQKPKIENSFGRTKSKAMKIYGDLKKVKQPISPGGRLATFLNSLFAPGAPKKAKVSSSTRASFNETISHNDPKTKSSCTSTCSSASSFSRSCLSNSSSREKTNGGAKRSVRFYPVSEVLGQENCPQYKSEMRNTIEEELKLHIMEKNRRVEEAARGLLKNYQKNVEYEYFDAKDTRRQSKNFFEDDDDDGDAASYASSDLFELDHLSQIEELPVYETTHLRPNLAIANGLIPKNG